MEGGSVSSENDVCRNSWIESAGIYIKKTQEKSLSLDCKAINPEVLKSLVDFLPGSQITDLNLSYNNLHNGMDALTQMLVKTEIQKLDVSACDLAKEDLFELMKALKHTKIVNLNIEENGFSKFNVDERDMFISHLLESHLNILSFDSWDFDEAGLGPFYDALVNTNIMRLVSYGDESADDLGTILSCLPHSSITELTLTQFTLDRDAVKSLSKAIRNSTLEELSLSENDLTDDGVDILVKGLIHSKITKLDLSCNKVCGGNTLGLRLKDTCIKILILDSNPLSQHGIFLSPDFLRSSSVTELGVGSCKFKNELFPKLLKCLKFSKVVELDLSYNKLQLSAVASFSKILKDTNLEKVDFSSIKLSQEALIALAEGVKDSKLHHINLSCCFNDPNGEILVAFLLEVKSSYVTSLDLSDNCLNEDGIKSLALQLEHSKFTDLDLSFNPIGNGVCSLASCLKFTKISHLFLTDCKVTDKELMTLANHLKETQLIELYLRWNEVTSAGAIALALSLKDSSLLHLDISGNKIDNNGTKALAQGAENTFITHLNVTDGDLLLDPVLWRNKLSVEHFTNAFKDIIPEAGNNSFRFTSHLNSVCADAFLEDCLDLYRNIIQRPSAIHVLLEDKSITLCKEEINFLMLDEFPGQFSLFIAEGVDTDVTEHVGLLKKAEDWGLSKVVELLLLNRPLYMTDKHEGVLDPYVYKLLDKYNYPICNLDIEPQGRQKLITYFTKHSDVEGASDVIRMLRGKRKM